jgi:ribA/ribD-fused uncharacterized protein
VNAIGTKVDAINFYSVTDEFGEFSNFARFPIRLKTRIWPTSEHYFQAMKFADASYREQIRSAATPMLSAKLGRSRKQTLRPDWESVKDSVMFDAVLAKFSQHDNLRALLLSTGSAKLVEHTTNDSYWGDGGDGSGKNRLGQILMQVRAQLITKS